MQKLNTWGKKRLCSHLCSEVVANVINECPIFEHGGTTLNRR